MTVADNARISVLYELSSDVLAQRLKGSVDREIDTEITNLITPAIKQAQTDALVGTFLDFSPSVFERKALFDDFAKRSEAMARIVSTVSPEKLRKGVVTFRLELQARMFSNYRTGLQHLIGVLIGDLFDRSFSQFHAKIKTVGVELESLEQHYENYYRNGRSHSIADIRRLFELDERHRMPLTAFTVKPRVGADIGTIERNAIGVLKAGFNLVEMDTRNLDVVHDEWKEAYFRIARAAMDIPKHVARFSLNLSMAPDLAVRLAREFKSIHPRSPWVVKVDGGLDGLSTVQALREEFPDDPPIITCYPILAYPLADRIGADTFRQFLSLSGVDIIYPGGTPRIGAGDFIGHQQVENGYARYWKILDRGWPMPSIAGGVHAGQLATYHEMFGPNVAYFIGGGVAAHRNGPFSGKTPKPPAKGTPYHASYGGSELCLEILRRCANLESTISPSYADLTETFSQVRTHYVKDDSPHAKEKFQFQSPGEHIHGSVRRYTERS